MTHSIELEDDAYCFVCGEKNSSGLHLAFVPHAQGVLAEFTPQKIHQGYKDITHGGLISTLLDEAVVKAALSKGLPAVTVEMSVRFRQPLYIGERATVEGRILRVTRKLIEAHSTVKKNDDTVVAEATAKLIRQDQEKPLSLLAR